jgi:DNA-binding winged helix-turn-helix (wHTH) protein/predicted ATPase
MLYIFESCILDSDRRELRRGHDAVPIQPQVFDLLEFLIRNRDRVVSRDDMIDAVWRGRIVSESTLASRISAARVAIGDGGEQQRLIRTLPRKGIRFVGAVQECEKAIEPPAAVIEVPSPETHVVTPNPPALPERRQLTVVSCELLIEGSSAAMDPEELGDVVGAWRSCVAEIAGRMGGRVAHSFGKIVLLLFGYPPAHEDDAEQAVRAALELCAGVSSLQLGSDLRVHARVGVATGPVIVSKAADDNAHDKVPVGEAPTTASRLQAAARLDSILICANTRQMIGSLFDCVEVGPITDSEVGQALPAWQVVGASLIESRFEALRPIALTPLVGREEEIELLIRRWSTAKSGEGRVVLISGEPGIGKSRLVAALEERLRPEPHARLRYFCAPNLRDSALRPIVAHIERAAGFETNDTAEAKLDKLEAVLEGSCQPEELAILADLLAVPTGDRYPRLDMPPRRKREKTFDTLLRRIDNLAERNPILMIFEDVHWIDPTSLELLDRMVERVTQLRVLLVITSRPEIASSWTGLAHAMTLVLNRLARRDGAALVDKIDGAHNLPRELIDRIVERTDGVPLFIEEMTKAVIETHGSHEAPTRASPPPATLSVPISLHSSLMARLDRIGPGRQVAQIGAVIGRHFSFDLIAALSLIDVEQLRTGLQELVDAQLLFCRGLPPDAEYTFKHALVQDVAYDSLLKVQRTRFHRQIAEVLRERFPAIADAQPELVARHLNEAQQWRDAACWWTKAGELSLRRSAFVEAVTQFENAITLADGPLGAGRPMLERLRLQTDYGQALIAARGHGAVETTVAFERARQLAAGIDDPEQRCSVYYGLWVGSYVRGEPKPLSELAETLLHETDGRRGSSEYCVAHRISGVTRWLQGDYVSARTHFELAVAAYDAERDRASALRYGQDIGVSAYYYLAIVLWALGEDKQSDRMAEQALSMARRSDHSPTLAYGHFHQCLLEAMRRNPQQMLPHAGALVRLSREHALPLWLAWGTFLDGWAQWHAVDRDSGLAQMRLGMTACREQGIALFMPYFEVLRAEVESKASGSGAGLAILDGAREELERTSQQWCECDLHRQRAELHLEAHPPNIGAARQDLERAIAVARRQQTKAFEVRAVFALAALAQP